jgi:hypothetical protein
MSSEPSTTPEAAGPTVTILGYARRRRREAPMRYLLDSALFRRLCAPGQDTALAGFRASMSRHGLAPAVADAPEPASADLPELELTPLGFLDVIGIEPPHFDFFPLPPDAIKSGESLTVTTLVVQYIAGRFREAAEIKADVLKQRVEELRQSVAPEAHDLFDLCLTRFVHAEGFDERIYNHLAFDFLYRFPFPELIREEVFDFLCASLFAAGETVSGLSKMRMIKAIWSNAYEKLLKGNPGARGEIQALDREMRLRNRKGYLDAEVVHYACLGYTAKSRIHPVTAFTLEPEERLRLRCIAYKSALRAFLDQIDREELAKIRSRLEAWRPGVLVPVQEDGTFDTLLPTGDLPVFEVAPASRPPAGR